MSCASPSLVFRLTLLILTFIVSCTFVASVVWLLRTSGSSSQYENYYLSRINISAVKSDGNNISTTPPVSDHYKDLIKIEIAMRRVEENSRRLKEYTKSLLWDNKDKSLWCVLFKENGRMEKPLRGGKHRHTIDEEYIRTLREQKMREALIHLRHHGAHHRRRPDVLPNLPYIK
ncbi:hypothetical protein PYW07_013760 [Mythimna separata]|uniref:Uncharacterized protein n=2 Tax=Mythimna TaxID=103830 RepID=A0AAD8DPP8_MYTSE|nr:hypothetical protein PYW07_013760 [Mythimna separata]KAJ8716213.1 hypothetical protein PYW08_013498 [Mythimna loreyi]